MKMQSSKSDIKEKIELFVLGELEEQEHKEVLDSINNDTELRKLYNQLRTIVKSEEYYRLDNNFNKDGSSKRLSKRILLSEEIKTTNFKLLFRLAASLFIITVLASLFYYFTQQEAEIPNEYCIVEAPLGAKSKVKLPDNTEVVLNAGSSIKYLANFNQADIREVDLVGEAYFDVAKNEHIPFIVKAKDVSIVAVGTAFNVKAYNEEETVEATLVEGIIEVSKDGHEESITLEPNQKISIFPNSDEANIENIIKKNQEEEKPLVKLNKIKNSDVFVQKDINTNLTTSWKDENWVIQKMSLGDLAVLLERKYNVKFEFDCKEINDFQFSGSFTNQTLELVLEALKLAAPIKYTVETGKVYVELDRSINRDYQRFLKKE